MTNAPALACTGLVAGYRRREVLHGLDFTIPDHSITGLLGPNGAGKSTLLRLLATITTPTSGDIRINGGNPADRAARNEIRKNLGYLPQNFTVDERLTVEEFVRYCLWMRLYPKNTRADAARQAIEAVGLADKTHAKIKELSGGMRRRAGIAACIAGQPHLIILDEPTAGLDPEQRYDFRQLLTRLRESENPPTILLSTHLIEDVASCADHLVVLGEGTIRYNGSAHALTDSSDRSIDALETIYRELLNGTHQPTGETRPRN